jgi:hypothetical protein
MYKVTHYVTGSSMVLAREFETLAEAVEFANRQQINSVIEIKKYDTKTNNIQNKPNNFRPD